MERSRGLLPCVGRRPLERLAELLDGSMEPFGIELDDLQALAVDDECEKILALVVVLEEHLAFAEQALQLRWRHRGHRDEAGELRCGGADPLLRELEGAGRRAL